MSRLEELRELAETAQAGEWLAVNPETVLALIALVEELRAGLAAAVGLLDDWVLDGEPLRVVRTGGRASIARAALASAATWMEE